MVTIYPSGISGTTGRNTSKQTQKISNANALCDGTTSLASWGEYTPSLCSGGITRYCNTLTTKSGSFENPEVINTTGWNIKNIDDNCIIKSIKIEYAYALAQYQGSGRGNINNPITFYLRTGQKETSKSANIGKATGKLPPHVSNTKTAKLTAYSVNISHPKTIKDLKNSHLQVHIGGNTASEFCRLLMQFIRIVVDYEDPTPQLSLSASLPSSKKINTSYTYELTVNKKTKNSGKTTCYVRIPKDTKVISKEKLSFYKNETSTAIYKANVTTQPYTVKLTVQHSTTGNKKFTAWLDKYGSGQVVKTINIFKPKISFNIIPQIADINSDTFTDTSSLDFKEGEKKIRFKITLSRDTQRVKNENVLIKTNKFINTWNDNNDNITIIDRKDGNWELTNLQGNNITLYTPIINLNQAGTYTVQATHKDEETSTKNDITYTIKVNSEAIKKDYFKIRVEDGTDIQYNKLNFTKGDDLSTPLTYESVDDTDVKDINFNIEGQEKKIPLDEAEYINFNINLDGYTETLHNILAYIEVYSEHEGIHENCNDIIVGIDNNGVLLEANDNKYCIIKELKPNKNNTLRLVVQSDTEQECIIKLRPYNYDLYSTKWTPSRVVFQDLPNIKLSIEGQSDIKSTDELELWYFIENKSDVDGKNLKFQIEEPSSFNIISSSIDYENVQFNPNKRIITCTNIPAHSQPYILKVKYAPQKKGVYDFIIKTLDNENTLDDDQHKNSYKHKVMVDTDSDIRIQTYVSNAQPKVNELIDFTIVVENLLKSQEEFVFNIKDIGDFNILHNESHYRVVETDYEYGTFEELTEDNNIGSWHINNIPANVKYRLQLTLQPIKQSFHNIQTDFSNLKANSQTFTNKVKVLEKKKQIDFNVYHAVNDNDADCSNIDELIPICDDDYIDILDNIYYVFEITNNDKNDIVYPINIYARLHESFYNNIICCSPGFNPSEHVTNHLLSFTVNQLSGCSTIRFCMKIKPDEAGVFLSNFMLSTKTSDVQHKRLQLTVGSEFKRKTLEHEIEIYNFEKTNKYYRYEIDSNGDIFKFFNKGDKSLRQIETEDYDINLAEKYKGTNLKKLVDEIAEHSKYVSPELLRVGSNKLANQAYELYPDGFIRRFGLLKSEIYHYANQFPITSNLVDYTMRWNVDDWDTKMWAGGNYDNGVFDLTIDYGKVPSNFTILDVDAMKNLQALVDKTKPFGTKGICYYSDRSKLNFGVSINDIITEVKYKSNLPIKISDMHVNTLRTKNNGELTFFNDAIYTSNKFDCNIYSGYEFNNKSETYPQEDMLSNTIDAAVTQMTVYDEIFNRKYISSSMDIVKNLYDTNTNTNDIDITIPYFEPIPSTAPQYLSDGYQVLSCVNNCVSNQSIGYEINYEHIKAQVMFRKEDNFEGFIFAINDNEINRREIKETVNNFSVMTQRTVKDNEIILHCWASANYKEYYHMGYISFIDKNISEYDDDLNASVKPYNVAYIDAFNSNEDVDCQMSYGYLKTEQPVTFAISDKIKKNQYEYEYIEALGKGWKYLKTTGINDYALFDFYAKTECKDTTQQIPKIACKFENLGLDKTDEIVDIDFEIKATSNKENFMDDVQVNLLKDGDYYLPKNTKRKIYYPNDISNTKRDLLTQYIVEEPNITICADCLKTTLGYYTKCPNCDSENVSHYDEKIDVTVCNTCGYVHDGTYDYCKYCLSLDVENVKVDYNKTYCNNCHTLSDGYYRYCPECFSNDTTYLPNDRKIYYLKENKQNIKPIVIKTNQNNINIFNITVPLGQNSDILNEIDMLKLEVDYSNNNPRQYYYCEDCSMGGLGNYEKCPDCNSDVVHNYQAPFNQFNIYAVYDGKYQRVNFEGDNSIQNGNDKKTIDILNIAKNVSGSDFTLEFYVENNNVESTLNAVLELPIKDKYISKITDKINNFDITINNLTALYNFKDNNDWIGLSNLEHDTHTYIKYETNDYEVQTESLKFSDFNIPNDNYSNVLLYISGICKTMSKHKMFVKISNGIVEQTKELSTNDIHFTHEIDIMDVIGKHTKNLLIEIYFEAQNVQDIFLTDVNIMTEKESFVNENQLITPIDISYTKNNNTYTITNENLWNINDTQPYYLSGRQLDSNLLAYIDFGELKDSEYIKLYEVKINVYYVSKFGKLTTESIYPSNDRNLEQYVNAKILNENGELWGAIKEPETTLNNLEYQQINIDEKGNLTNSLHLLNKISQSFIYQESTIYQINLQYFGKKGYPSDVINVYLHKDNNNKPGELIARNKATMQSYKGIINIAFDVDNLDINKKYWIVLEDTNADKNNYHRFYCSDNSLGELIVDNKKTTRQSLCFSVDHAFSEYYYDIPIYWTINTIQEDDNIEYKISSTLYRYNKNSNVYISDLVIKNGYNEMIIDENED